MTRERPTVMKRPQDSFFGSFQIIKQRFYVNIISVDIMQMDNIGIIFLYPTYKPLGRAFAAKARRVEQPCL